MIKYAPIIIPTLCRYEHFVRLMESLRRNAWAKYTDIYVGLDYPSADKYQEGYKKICEYLKGDFSEFASIHVFKHEQNLGSFANSAFLREFIFQKYDRFIYTDDDVEFSPNFIEYMDKCLMEYEKNPDVIAVTGYSYPVKWKVSENATVFKQNFICPMWGTGFWVDKYKKVKKEIEIGCLQRSVDFVFRNGILDRMLDASKVEYINLCLSPIFKETLASRMTDVAVRMYTAINDKYVICPVISKVRNWGFDGTGEFCSKHKDKKSGNTTTHNYPFCLQQIDESKSFDLILDNLNDIIENKFILDKFESVPWKSKVKVSIKKSIYQYLGKDLWLKLYTLKMRNKVI